MKKETKMIAYRVRCTRRGGGGVYSTLKEAREAANDWAAALADTPKAFVAIDEIVTKEVYHKVVNQ